MPLYQILGLIIAKAESHSYETETASSRHIKHDAHGKGIPIPRIFTKYILYVVLGENEYYAIHLSDEHAATFGGKLCTFGAMEIRSSSHDYIMENMTHEPIGLLEITADFKVGPYNYDDDMCVHPYGQPDVSLFEFSILGGDERDPCGYVYVNLDLFRRVGTITNPVESFDV